MKITNIEVKYPIYKDDLKDWRPKLWQIITKISTNKKDKNFVRVWEKVLEKFDKKTYSISN